MDRDDMKALARWLIANHRAVYIHWCRQTDRARYDHHSFAKFALLRHPELVVLWRMIR